MKIKVKSIVNDLDNQVQGDMFDTHRVQQAARHCQESTVAHGYSLKENCGGTILHGCGHIHVINQSSKSLSNETTLVLSNTRELDRVPSTSSLPYILLLMVRAYYCAPYPKRPCVRHETNMCCPCCMTSLYSRTFYPILSNSVIRLVTMPSTCD